MQEEKEGGEGGREKHIRGERGCDRREERERRDLEGDQREGAVN